MTVPLVPWSYTVHEVTPKYSSHSTRSLLGFSLHHMSSLPTYLSGFHKISMKLLFDGEMIGI